MYITKQKVNGKDYFYLRKAVREGDKVKSKHVAYLGKTREEAENKYAEILKNSNSEEESMEEKNNLFKKEISVEELAKFCKEKGFVYRSSDIYGGFAGFWDFGPLGVELKNSLKKEWWNYFVNLREDVVGMDGSIITHPQVWRASGHVDNFSDVFVVCKKCKKPGKVDRAELGKVKCDCGGEYDESTAKDFKLMFQVDVGQNDKSYLRPETAQLIFADFKTVYDNSRVKLPFGIAQIGKAFRNEIAPRDFLFRSREFEQMEMQYFIDPDKKSDCPFYKDIMDKKISILDSNKNESLLSINQMVEKGIFKTKWHAYWLVYSYDWFLGLGINKENLRLREHEKTELAHYANAAVDIEYNFPGGWKEIFGSHDRGDFDLSQHEKFSKKDLKIFDEESKKKVLPSVVESSFGVERAFMAFLFDSYFIDDKDNNILKLSLQLSPIKVAVFPLVKRDDFEKISKEIVKDLRKEFNVAYDRSGSIGRRYARNDEIGTPFCITIDEDSANYGTVTIRNRDTKQQKRVKIKDLKNILRDLINLDKKFESL